MIVLALVIVVVILMIAQYFKKPPRYYQLLDFPKMRDFHDAYADIKQECIDVLGQPIHNIYRSSEVWNNSVNKKKAEDFLNKHQHIQGWMPAWAPGSSGANYQWLNFPLVAVGHDFKNNLALCPKLAGLINKYKDSINICGFSLLKPGAILKTHTDTTGLAYGTMAYHLGLIVPEKCNLIVDGIETLQKEGQSIIFDSTYPHSAKNDSAEDRVILYIDFKI